MRHWSSVLLVILLVLLSTHVQAQAVHWSKRSGSLVDGATKLAAAKNGHLFATGPLGFWVSEDHGYSWQHRLDSIAIHGSFVVIGDTILLLEKDIRRSIDDGVTWTTVQTLRNGATVALADTLGDMLLYDGLLITTSKDGGRTWKTDTTARAISPWKFGPNRILWAYYYGQFFVSSDLGLTWTYQGLRAPSAWDTSGVYYTLTHDSILVSLDTGRNWQYRSSAPRGTLLGLSNGAFWIVSDPGGDSVRHVARSVDGCRSWTQMPVPRGRYNEASVLEEGDNFFLGSEDGVFLSTDHGVTWSMPNRPVYCNRYEVPSICAGPDGKVFVYNNYGVWRTQDAGDSWQLLNLYHDGTRGPRLRESESATSLLATPIDVYCGSNYSMFRVDSALTSWSQILPDTNMNVTELCADRQGTLYANCERRASSDHVVLYSTDAGLQWQDCTPANWRVYAMTVSSAGTVLAAADLNWKDSKIIRKTGISANWVTIDTGTIHTLGTVHNKIFYITTNSTLHRSFDGGITFDTVALSGLAVNHEIVFDSAGGMLIFTVDGLMRSTDDGVSWVKIDSGLDTPLNLPSICVDERGYGWYVSSVVYRTDVPIGSTSSVHATDDGAPHIHLTQDGRRLALHGAADESFTVSTFNILGEQLASSTTTSEFELPEHVHGSVFIVVTTASRRQVFKVHL